MSDYNVDILLFSPTQKSLQVDHQAAMQQQGHHYWYTWTRAVGHACALLAHINSLVPQDLSSLLVELSFCWGRTSSKIRSDATLAMLHTVTLLLQIATWLAGLHFLPYTALPLRRRSCLSEHKCESTVGPSLKANFFHDVHVMLLLTPRVHPRHKPILQQAQPRAAR